MLRRTIETLPKVKAEIEFLPPEQGGRRNPPFDTTRYMPHFVVEMGPTPSETPTSREYLGVRLLGTEDKELVFGPRHVIVVELMYSPRVDYSELQIGCSISVREGARVVGLGTVLDIEVPDDTC